VDETDTATLHRLMPTGGQAGLRHGREQAAGAHEDGRRVSADACQLDDVAMLIALNGGAFVDAGPGCGKTRVLLPRLVKAFRAAQP
jgi:hypothetical protein